MRYLLLALMIALLPIRGWASNSMAVSMAAGQIQIAQHGDTAKSAMPDDCPMFAQTAAGTEKLASPDFHGDGCSSCDLCLAMAVQTFIDTSVGLFAPPTGPLSGSERFSSAEVVSSLKPPIS